jgi:hypothetical protein
LAKSPYLKKQTQYHNRKNRENGEGRKWAARNPKQIKWLYPRDRSRRPEIGYERGASAAAGDTKSSGENELLLRSGVFFGTIFADESHSERPKSGAS